MSDKKSLKQKVAHDHEMDARRSMMEELFNDYYKRRLSVYKMNFVRGVFFGFGAFLGGTIVVAIVIWALSFFVNIPGIGDAAQRTVDQLESTQSK